MRKFHLFTKQIDENGVTFYRYYNRDSRMWTRWKDDCKPYDTIRAAKAQLTRLEKAHRAGKRAMCHPCENLFQWGVIS
jgi:hypothetical protein